MYQVGILSCWVSEEARESRILSLGTLRIRVDLLHISSATHGGILICIEGIITKSLHNCNASILRTLTCYRP